MAHQSYQNAKERYAEFGVDTEKVLKQMENISLSLHCWQGDDIGGFERPDSKLDGGGIQVTGNYPGKARNIEDLRQDMEKALSLIPCKHRINLHAIYGDFGGKFVDRNKIEPEHYDSWLDWGEKNNLKLDFNPTLFSHTNSDSGFTLSSKNPQIRKFWIEHCNKSREISVYIGKQQKSPCINNIWIPDGSKDIPIDRFGYRKILKQSLDEILSQKYSKSYLKDALEGKLFGIGSEAFVVGSYDFYLGYTLANDLMICLDMGHFHPTENVGEKIPSILQFSNEILMHVSRGIRWDSDHVVILDDKLLSVMHEIIRTNALDKINFSTDFFDGSINRIGAWVIGATATLKALLISLLEPYEMLLETEESGDYFKRLVLLEEMKFMPFEAIWNHYCEKKNVLTGIKMINEIHQYEINILGLR